MPIDGYELKTDEESEKQDIQENAENQHLDVCEEKQEQPKEPEVKPRKCDDVLHIGDGKGHRMFAAPTGGGKSYTVGAAIEQLYAKGIRFVILDTKMQNHIGLARLPGLYTLRIDPRLEYKNLQAILKYNYLLCVPARKNIAIGDLIEKYRQIIDYYWMNDTNRIIICEEAHNYNKNASVPDPLLEQIAREGRSYGMFVWFITQRLQNFSHLLWSQCSYTYLWQFKIPPDIKYACQMVPDFDRLCSANGELKRYDVLIWDGVNYEVVNHTRISRRTQHKG